MIPEGVGCVGEAGFACPGCATPMDHVGWSQYICPNCGGRWVPDTGEPPPPELCPTCKQPGMATEPDENGVRICEICKCEVWPPSENYLAQSPEIVARREAQWAWADELRYKKSISSPGGGSKSGRRRKKQAKRRPYYEEGA